MRFLAVSGSATPALVDDEFFAHIARFKWTANKQRGNVYAVSTTASGSRSMHRMVARLAGIQALLLDHKNRNGLDNRRDNLRPCDHAQNGWNVVRPTGASGIPGVYRNRKKWAVRFDHRGERIYLGSYSDIEEAARIAEQAQRQLRGEFFAGWSAPTLLARLAEIERYERMAA